MPYRISRRTYAETYGPTTGDRLRLADTDLILEVEGGATVPLSQVNRIDAPYVAPAAASAAK